MKKTQILKMQTTESQSSENSAENTDKQHSSEQLIEKTQIGNTPFTAVKHEGQLYLTLGRYKLAEGFIDMKQIMDYMEENKWHCIAVLIQAILDEEKQNVK